MAEKVNTGGMMEFIHEGKDYEDTESTREFKKVYAEWLEKTKNKNESLIFNNPVEILPQIKFTKPIKKISRLKRLYLKWKK